MEWRWHLPEFVYSIIDYDERILNIKLICRKCRKREEKVSSLFRIAMFSSRKKEGKRKNFLPLKKHYLMLGQSEGNASAILLKVRSISLCYEKNSNKKPDITVRKIKKAIDGLEPAVSTLARSRVTNYATIANVL